MASIPYLAERHLFSWANQAGMVGSSLPWSSSVERCSTRQWLSAASARTSVRLVAPSQMRVSSVPNRGDGRRSQRTSSNWSITPVWIMSPT
ncbi:hypothetical protein D3C74_367540 [compost metagenome]